MKQLFMYITNVTTVGSKEACEAAGITSIDALASDIGDALVKIGVSPHCQQVHQYWAQLVICKYIVCQLEVEIRTPYC